MDVDPDQPGMSNNKISEKEREETERESKNVSDIYIEIRLCMAGIIAMCQDYNYL